MIDVQQYLAGELREVLGDAESEDGLPLCELAAAVAVRVLSGSLYSRGDIARIESKVRRDEARRIARALRALDVPDGFRGTAAEAVYAGALMAAVAAASSK